jgi:hypothetical protein
MIKMIIRNILVVMISLGGMSASAEGKISIFGGQGGDFNLLEFAPKLLTGNIKMADTYFVAINYKEKLNGLMADGFNYINLEPEVEYQITKHGGLQDIVEVHSALVFRSKTWSMKNGIGANVAGGFGLSYALSEPTYEVAVDNQRYRFQNHLSLEVELTKKNSDFSIPIRIHHRSGIYGLIAPPKVGSNFLAIGLRWKI